ncbi:MAG TPA: TRAP transporter substrate-binding protein [Burkholderiales bacterium]|jgi:tripartite ATP-independent transporter DctP family solute receptor|nr:TRAP transporter substrate-binding protein [Burkholderiales bacterium]
MKHLNCIALAAALAVSSTAFAQKREFSFAYDQPRTSAYGYGADFFGKKLQELSKGTLGTNQYPGAQLGTEAQTLQKVQTGDIDFVLVSTANSSTIQPESGVFSLHFIFLGPEHAVKVLTDPKVIAAMREMYAAKVKGAHMLTLGSQGLRNLYCKKEIKKLADIKNVKVRVQATVTEDTLFPAYGAQIVHMPFGEVYTSLQTGVVECAENGYTVYMLNKHYEVAPVMSVTEHEANNSVLFVSDKVWSSLNAEQKKWVQTAADEMNKVQPAKAFEMEKESRAKLEKMGVKIVTGVDKSGFESVSKPIQDKLAKELGPNAVKILALVRSVK